MPEVRMSARTAPWTAEKRAAHSAKMRVIMNDPTVRQRVSQGTKAGMQSALSDELRLLRTLWVRISPAARKRFLDELFSPLCLENPDFGPLSERPFDQAANLPLETGGKT
jgi:O-methyltransferase involved in polyketide biosynthesis